MNRFLPGLLGALLAANSPAAPATNLLTATNAVATNAAATNPLVTNAPAASAAVEEEYHKLLRDDDAAMSEVDGWIRENEKFAAKGGGVPRAELNQRIRARFATVRAAYENFIKRHPDYAKARLAYASFLDDIGDADAELPQLEAARKLAPNDPAVWNNLANYHGHYGGVKKAFDYYARAIQLDPTEPVYFENLAVTVYLFRKDAREYYHITEAQVFDKALDLYAQALKLDPTNFVLASDLAASYYEIRPMPTDRALAAWTNALHIAKTEIEREGVYIHFARIKMNAGRFAQAQASLDAVTNAWYADLKRVLLRNLREKETAAATNRPAGPTNPPTGSIKR